jgi:hypothetical protein
MPKEKLRVFINENYDRSNGYYCRKSAVRWMLIWWLKPDNTTG